MRVKAEGVLGMLRRGGRAVARMLLLALALQLLSPLLDFAAAARAATLEADIALSICHDQGDAASPLSNAASPGKAPHCVFCLPLVGGHWVAPDQTVLTLPRTTFLAVLHGLDSPHPTGIRGRTASARDPPIHA